MLQKCSCWRHQNHYIEFLRKPMPLSIWWVTYNMHEMIGITVNYVTLDFWILCSILKCTTPFLILKLTDNPFWMYITAWIKSFDETVSTMMHTFNNKAVLEPRVSPAFAITYFCNHCNIRFENTSKYVDTLTLFSKNLNQRSLTPRWPLTPCLLRSHVWLYPRIIVSKSHDNTSMYVDTVINFAKYHIHTHTYYILHTHTTYRMSDHIVSYWTQFRRDNYWTQFRRDKNVTDYIENMQ